MTTSSFFQIVKKRRSVRSFLDKPVESWKLQTILKTVLLAPSAANLQSFKIFVVTDKKRKVRLVMAADCQQHVNAPIVLIFCTNPKRIKTKFGRRGEKVFSLQDATIAATYSQLVATSLGLSSIWIGRFSEDGIRKIIRTRLRPIAIISIGYSKEMPKPKKIKKLAEIVHRI